MEDWRRSMHYPPKLSEVWRSLKELHLYGYDDDEDEENFLTHTNPQQQKILNALPLPESDVSAEEQLELMGYASSAEHASLILTGRAQQPVPQLYTPEIDDNPHAENALEDLADVAMQLQEAIAAGHTDPGVLTVINQTRDFLENGIAPPKGLDEIDRLLMRKRHLIRQCGRAETHRINWNNISVPLLCAVRVTVMKERDVDVLCPKATGAWNDHKCVDGIFDPEKAVTPENEAAMLKALKSTIETLLSEFKTDIEEDEALLAISWGPAKMSAIILRMREKKLLIKALKEVEVREDDLKDLVSTFNETNETNETQTSPSPSTQEETEGEFGEVFQLTRVKRQRQELEEARARRLRHNEEIRKEFNEAYVVKLPVNLGPEIGEVSFVVHEGESFDTALQQFCRKYKITNQGAEQLKKSAKARITSKPQLLLAMQVPLGDGRAATIVVRKQDNVTEAVYRLLALHNVTLEVEQSWAANLTEIVKDAVDKRQARRIIVSVPVTAPDGRSLQVEIREGEQHDLATVVRGFCDAMRLSRQAIHQIVQVIESRLPPAVFILPVPIPEQKVLMLRVTERDLKDDNLITTVSEFCEAHNLPMEGNVQSLSRAVWKGLMPSAYLL